MVSKIFQQLFLRSVFFNDDNHNNLNKIQNEMIKGVSLYLLIHLKDSRGLADLISSEKEGNERFNLIFTHT